MKNTIKLFGIIALMAVIVFTMAACGGGGKIPNGKYVASSSGWSYEISGNKVQEFNSSGVLQDSGTYQIDKDGLFIFNTDKGKVEKHSFNLNGNTLTIGGTAYTKQ